MTVTGRPAEGSGPRRAALEDDERWARVAWSFLAEPCSGPLTTELEERGAVEALARLRTGGLRGREGWQARLPELDVDALAHAVDRQGLHVLVPGDPAWPSGVERLERPPYCLFVRGDPDLSSLVERSVAVVGSRAATEYGLRVAADISGGLVARGWTVVSGAAYGIDAAAHRAALARVSPWSARCAGWHVGSTQVALLGDSVADGLDGSRGFSDVVTARALA